MLSRIRGKARSPLAAVAAVVLAGAALLSVTGCAAGAAGTATGREKHMTSQPRAAATASLTADLAAAARARVFFGHQSVGMNILDGVPGVYAAHGMPAPLIEEGATRPGDSGGFIDHVYIGENEYPVLKVKDFAAALRSGLGQRVSVAMMKFCFVDVTSGTDVSALFRTYQDTMTALQREFPQVTFVAVTVPLTTEPGLLSRVKSKLTGSSGAAADNVARQRLNALIRQHYSGSHLFDLAAIESTAPDGTRVTGSYDGQRYYALYDGYASDEGHLNATGARIVATAWLQAIARAAGK